MTRRALSQGWIAAALVAAAISIAALTSFSKDGMQVEAGGIEMTLKASATQGVKLIFAAT